MKTTTQKYLLLVLLLVTAIISNATAQKLDKDALAFTKSYQDNYNKGDLAALMEMYANEITLVNSDGTTEKVPKSYFEKDYIRDFGEAAGTYLTLKVTNTEKLSDGKVKITGSFDGYDFDRKSNTKLNPTIGTFENVIMKDGGKWRFTQVKTVFAMEQVFKDVRTFVQNFQDAYNKEDASAIQALFTADGTRMMADGKTTKGAENIANDYAENFKNANAALTLKLSNVLPQFDKSMIVTGTYQVYGTSLKGDKVSLSGSYDNKLVNENGQWKLAEVKLGGLVKVFAYTKIADFDKWKTSFDAFRRVRRDAGELTFEVSTLADDPNTVCVISEWATVEKAKAFFALPELAAQGKKAGLTDELHIMYLNKK
ncbi:nuclear transport factor 2 family protein [Pedobacter immunditicola]|uniref:nuclear transport factor 2 family protein n=1 Tax=Pedobacter immunditicola TaxID=3133440 RepID=UPI00309D922E